MSRVLVIDACVARGAGRTEDACHPRSKACRAVLQAVMSICHKISMSLDVYEEWKNHEGAFAKRWRAGMVARKKFVLARPAASEQIRAAVENSGLTAGDLERLKNDLHLIEAALEADKCIVTVDQRLITILKQTVVNSPEIGQLDIVNAEIQLDPLLNWLNDGAPDGHFRVNP